MQREIDSVDVFAAQGGVHDGGRQRLRDGVSANAINFCGGVNLVDTICALQLLRGDLPGGGLFVRSEGSEGEGAAGAGSKYTADDALLAHAHSNQGVLVAMPLQELHHGYVVVKRGCGADDLVEVGGISGHFGQGFVQLLGGAEVVEGQDNCGLGAQFRQLCWFQAAGSL